MTKTDIIKLSLEPIVNGRLNRSRRKSTDLSLENNVYIYDITDNSTHANGAGFQLNNDLSKQ